MERTAIGIPYLKFHEIRDRWAQRMFEEWNRVNQGDVTTPPNIENMLTIAPYHLDECIRLLNYVAEHCTLEQFLQNLRENGLNNLADEFQNDINHWSTNLPLCDSPRSEASFFFLFTKDVSSAHLIDKLLASGWLEEGKTIKITGLIARRLSNRNQHSRISIIIGQITSTDSAGQFVDLFGHIPNLVIVHKKVSNIGHTQLCLLNHLDSHLSRVLDVITSIHSACRSNLKWVKVSMLDSIAQLLTSLQGTTLHQLAIILDSDESENHLPCLLNSLIWANLSLFPTTGPSLLQLSFKNEKRQIEYTGPFSQIFPAEHRLIVASKGGSEVITSVSTFQAYRELFNTEDLINKLKTYLLTLTEVKILRPLNLIALHSNLSSSADQTRIRLIGNMFNVTIDPADLPETDGVVLAEGAVVPMVIEEAAVGQLGLLFEEEAAPNPPTILVVNAGTPNLQNVQNEELLRAMLVQATILKEGQTLNSGTSYWIAVKSEQPIVLTKNTGEPETWTNEVHINGYRLLQMNLQQNGSFCVIVGAMQLAFNVADPIPNRENILLLVPDSNVEQRIRHYLASVGFVFNDTDRALQQPFYQRGSQRAILLKPTDDPFVLTDLLFTFAGKVALFTNNIEQRSAPLMEQQVNNLALGKQIIYEKKGIPENNNYRAFLNRFLL